MKGLVDDKFLVKSFDHDGSGDFHHYDSRNNKVAGRSRSTYDTVKFTYDYFVINGEDEGESISYDERLSRR